MQELSFPLWVKALVANPKKMRLSFTQTFSGTSLPTNIKLSDLITLFGRTNQTQVAQLLSSTLKENYQICLKTQRTRFFEIIAIASHALSHHEFLDLERLNSYYELSVFSSDNIQERVLEEILEYLLSLSMPTQEARHLKCHTIKVIQTNLEAHQRDVEEAIAFLFEMTLANPQPERGQSLTLRQEQLIFKYAALKGYEKIMSWGHLLFIWLRVSQQGQLVTELFHSAFLFDKLLITENQKSQQQRELSPLTFSDFVVEQTAAFVFRHPQSLFPQGIAEDRFKRIIARSIRAQQDCVYFLDYLHQLPRTDAFPFEEAFSNLQTLIPDSRAEHYLFLYQCLHFLNCRFKLDTKIEEMPCLFKMILSFDCAEEIRKNKEDFAREPPSPILLSRFAKKTKLSLNECAHIIVKFVFSHPKAEPSPCPFLNFEQHLQALEQIEHALGLRLPMHITADFLFFQTARPELFKAIKSWLRIRSIIIEQWLDSVAIPRDLYKEWQAQSIALFELITLNQKTSMPAWIAKRQQTYTRNMFELASILQLGIYPQPMAAISSCMPVAWDETGLKYNREAEALIDCLVPFFEYYPTGPGRLCRWIFHPPSRQWHFSISILNALDCPQTACTFQVPLEIPESIKDQMAFFKLLGALADALGNEVLNEDEEEIWRKLKIDHAYSVPNEVLCMEGKPEDIFDALIACSPLLIKLWKEHEHLFGNDAPKIKIALYTFIKSYRVSFKRAFYFVLNYKELDSMTTLKWREKDHFRVVHFDNESKGKGEVSPLDVIPIFEEVYQKVHKQESSSNEDVLEIDLGKKLESKLSIKIRRIAQKEQQSYAELFQVSMVSLNKQLQINYLPFLNKDQFVQLMLWQMDLLMQDNSS